MTAITAEQAYALLRQSGATPTQAALLTAIGEAESGLNPYAMGDTSLENSTWGPSVGVWQERTLKADTGKGTSRDISYLQSSVANQAKAAIATLNSSGPSAWSAYTSGAYLKYTGSANAGATAANASYAETASWGSVLGGILGGLLFGPGGQQLGSQAGGEAEKKSGDTVKKAASDEAQKVAAGLWGAIMPFALQSIFAVGGIALVVIGVVVTAKPEREAIQSKSQQAEQLAAMIA